jgi:group I intron endonuclease
MKIRNSDYKKEPGIYIITNLINGKVYVGESMNIKHRIYEYTNNVFNRPIKYGIRKHGLDNFDIQVEYLPYFTKEDLLLLEEELIKRFDSRNKNKGYNICVKGTDNTGRVLTQEHKDKIGDGNRNKIVSQETKDRMSAYQSNMPDSHKQLISEGKKKKKHKHSEATKKIMSDKKKGKPAWNKGLKTGRPPWNKGLKTPQESIDKIRESKIGVPSPKKGKKYPRVESA